ncbi:hypothetical protein [Prochlorococcus sp. MIT 0604]|uniref:hypothetical protein n=1 Tax=Prochlorococcus sp. MIT 0604 TaxID=1501268 RepID=UPI0005B4B4D9|nr:hypothetical protein [Prochlorococcus sp. MIT 0604]
MNPPSWKVASTNPPSLNTSTHLGTKNSMEGMEGSNTKNSFKNKKDFIYIKEKRKKTLHTLQPSIIDIELAVGSAWDTGSDDDPHWDTLLE